MVRLKVNSSISIGVSASRFQFQYGAIKGLISEKIQMPFRSFNSSMVRLKAEQQEEAANMLLGSGLAAFIGLVSGIIPAISASKLDPVEAIRTGM